MITKTGFLQHKRSVVRTLLSRADTLVTEPEDQQQERSRIRNVLKDNDYKDWIFATQERKPREENDSLSHVVLPYVHGVSENLTKIFRDHRVRVFHKPYNTLRNQLVHPKDKSEDCRKCGVVYKIDCPECNSTYVGETARNLGVRLKEHVSKYSGNNSAVGEHCKLTSHHIGSDNIRILSREDRFWTRKIRESVEIRCNRPNLNRDNGYELPAVYLNLLRPSEHQRASLNVSRKRAFHPARGYYTSTTDEDPAMGSKALDS